MNKSNIHTMIKNKSFNSILNKKYSNTNLYSNINNKYKKISLLNKSSSFKILHSRNPTHSQRNISFINKKKQKLDDELSVALFQNNEIELVQNLNLDSDRDLCSNSILKEQLKNKINPMNLTLLYSSGQKSKRPTLPKISFGSTNILENEKKINNFKQKFTKNRQTILFEQELNNKLRNVNEIFQSQKEKRDKLYDNYGKILKELDNINLDLQILNNQKSKHNSPQKRRQSRIDMLSRRKSISKASFKDNTYESNNSKSNSRQFEGSDTNREKSNNEITEVKNENNEEIKEENKENKEENKNDNQNENNRFNRRLSVIQALYQEQKKKDLERRIKYEHMLESKRELKQIKSSLNSVSSEINELKLNKNNIKQTLMRHYQELLYNGKEVRNEGLIWIIKSIWKLGENVPMSFMPTFLDYKGIKFLFNLAIKSVELETQKKYMLKLKDNLRSELNNIAQKNEKEKKVTTYKYNEKNKYESHKKEKKYPFLFKTNLLIKNEQLPRSLSQEFVKSFYHSNQHFDMNISSKIMSHNNEDEEDEIFKSNIKEISKIFENKDNSFDIIKMPMINEKHKLEEKIKELEAEIQNMKDNEIKRIFKEYIDNDYQNKYHAPIDVVLGALLGEHSRNIHVNKFNSFKKEYLDEMKNIRFYEYTKRKS